MLALANIKIAWGRDANGELIHISSLPQGIGRSCGLTCPDCNVSLEARQGDIRRWYFAHAVATACEGETVLHKVAKQVLLKAAESFKKLRLPERRVKRTRSDILNYEHLSEGVFPDQLSVLSGAREEVRLSSGQVADAVVITEALYPRPLVVEVFVTHKKSIDDVELFRAMEQDAIEINISALDWSASFADIEKAVLVTAPRKWLHTNLDESLAGKACEDADKKAAEESQRYVQTLELRVSELANYSPSEFSIRCWSELSVTTEGTDSSGKTHFGTSSISLVVDSFPADWSWRDGLWWSSTTVNKISVDLVAVISEKEGWQQLVKSRVTSPTLVVLLPVRNEIADFNTGFEWIGVEKWLVRLKKQAQLVLERKLGEANNLNSNLDSFIHSFRNMDDARRLSYICSKMGASPPAVLGRRDAACNAPAAVWKRLVWSYGVVNATDVVSTEWVADHTWLRQLLEFSDDEWAQQQRKKSTWFFLRKLEDRGWISHIGRQRFIVRTNLKDKAWQSWMDER